MSDQELEDGKTKCDLCDCEFTQENPKYESEGYTIDKHLGFKLHESCLEEWLAFWKANEKPLNISGLAAFEMYSFIKRRGGAPEDYEICKIQPSGSATNEK